MIVGDSFILSPQSAVSCSTPSLYNNCFYWYCIQVTVDTGYECLDDFGATSAATAMASGLIALTLEAK